MADHDTPLRHYKDSLKALLHNATYGSQSQRVTSEDPALPRLLQSVEGIVNHGLCEGLTFWDFIQHLESLGDDPALSAVKRVPRVEHYSKEEKSRLWIIYALSHKSLFRSIESINLHADITGAYYEPHAFLQVTVRDVVWCGCCLLRCVCVCVSAMSVRRHAEGAR